MKRRALVAMFAVLGVGVANPAAAPVSRDGPAAATLAAPDDPASATLAREDRETVTPLPADGPADAAAVARNDSDSSQDVFVGVIVPLASVDLSSEIQAPLQAAHVSLGDRVSKGQLLMTLDAWQLRHEVEIARPLLLEAEARARIAALEKDAAVARLTRREALPDAWSAEDLESARMDAERVTILHEIAAAEAMRHQAELDRLLRTVEAAQVRAPFSGVVAEILTQPGALVERGTRMLRLVSDDQLFARFAVPEAESGRIEPGAEARIILPLTGTELRANVLHIAPDLDPLTQMLTVEAPVELPDSLRSLLRSGMLVHVRLVSGTP